MSNPICPRCGKEQAQPLHTCMSKPTPDMDADYTKAVWAWLRCETLVEPLPEQFGLHATLAATILRQCEHEFRQRKKP